MGRPKKCKDHLGFEFNSITEMCKFWKVKQRTFSERLKHGHTLEESLTGVGMSEKHTPRVWQDHLGNEFKTKKAMCEYWGVPTVVFDRRYNLQLDMKTCLTEKYTPRQSPRKQWKDHLGNKFKNRAEMCRHWGISTGVFAGRYKKGFCLQYCLTGKGYKNIKFIAIDGRDENAEFIDHVGRRYNSLEEMCSNWNVSVESFKERYKYGYSLQASLTGEGVKDEFK